MPVIMFPFDGEAGIEGKWITMTAARSLNTVCGPLLHLPAEATHWVHYTSGSSSLDQKWIWGATTTTVKAFVLAQTVENGTLGGGDAEGTLLLNQLSGDLTGENVKLLGGSDDATIGENPVLLRFPGCQARAMYITVEVATLQVSISGAIPTVTSGTNIGFNLAAAQNMTLRGISMLKAFKAINAVNASGSIMKYALLY